MLVRWTVIVLLAAVRVRTHEHKSNFNAWNAPQTRTSNIKELRPHSPEIIYINPVPMGSNGLHEQNDAIVAVYGPTFLRGDWIWDDFDSQNHKYNFEHGEKRDYQNLDINYNRDGMRDIYSHEIDPSVTENYNYEHERNVNPDVKYNQERGRMQSQLYIYEREQNAENRNWRSQETQDTERNYAYVRENYDDERKHENKKPIFPRLHQLKVDAKRVLEGLVSKIRALLPQSKHLEDKDIIHLLRGLDDRLLRGVGHRTKERIKNIREQFIRFESEKVIERKPKLESIDTVGNRLYPGYDDNSSPQRLRPEEGQYVEGGDYGLGNNETPHGWGRGYQPSWARIPEVSVQGSYRGREPSK